MKYQKFNFNREMAEYILKINEIKLKLKNLKENSSEYNDLIKEIDYQKKEFIKCFQKYNKEEIKEYVGIKD